MTDSVFSKMLKGEIPRELIYEDDVCFVIPTIAPHTRGHVMVITNEQVANWQDLDEKTYQHVMGVVKMIGKVLKRVYNPVKVGVEIVGFEVEHVHIHVIPFFKILDMDHTQAKQIDSKELKLVADEIRKELKKMGQKS